MGLFGRKRRSKQSQGARVRLSWHGEGEPEPVRSLIRVLVGEYERILSNPEVKITTADETLWAAVSQAALWHRMAMNRALRVVPSADPYLTHPIAQNAIGRAMAEFGAHFDVDGALVSCWASADLFNKETQGRWTPKPRGFWWNDLPLTFACWLIPRDPCQVPIAGLLIADDAEFVFTPHRVDLPQLAFTSALVAAAESRDSGGSTLIFKPDAVWERAEFCASGIPPTTVALHRAGLLELDGEGALRELLDEAVRDGSMAANEAAEILREAERARPEGDLE